MAFLSINEFVYPKSSSFSSYSLFNLFKERQHNFLAVTSPTSLNCSIKDDNFISNGILSVFCLIQRIYLVLVLNYFLTNYWVLYVIKAV